MVSALAGNGVPIRTGKAGTVLHFDGSTWSAMDSPTTTDLNKVWGNSPSDVFAVGTGGRLLHYDGRAWSAMSCNASTTLTEVWRPFLNTPSSQAEGIWAPIPNKRLMKDAIGWKRVEEGRKVEIEAERQLNRQWAFYRRWGRNCPRIRFEAPLEEWMELLDTVKRRVGRRVMKPKDVEELEQEILERFSGVSPHGQDD